MSSFGQRLSAAFHSYGQLCVGIDPSQEQLKSWGLAHSVNGAKEFSSAVLDAVEGLVGIVKPQVAFFEQYGSAGIQLLASVLEDASSRGLLVIADAKRGDIGSTMDGYTRAWLGQEASFSCDALTLSPYLGPESLSETIEVALSNDRGVFVLAATSNPEAKSVQAAIGRSGISVASEVVAFAGKHNAAPLGSVGVVIGATVELDGLGIDSSQLIQTPILMPGFGAQGSKLSMVRQFGSISNNLICNVSRQVAGSSRFEIRERVLQAKRELELGLAP